VEFLLLVHLAATLVMVGIIWFVQVVHYPLFGRVGTADFSAYSGAHSRLTGLVVDSPMLAEAGTGALLLFIRPEAVPEIATWTGLLLLAGVWLSTAILQAPRHRNLGRGFDASTHRFLVLSNWLRIVLWSARGLLVLWMAALVMG